MKVLLYFPLTNNMFRTCIKIMMLMIEKCTTILFLIKAFSIPIAFE